MGSSHTQQQSTNQEGPWGPVNDTLQGMIPQAQQLEQTEAGWQPFGGYQGNTYAGFTPAQLQSMGMTSGIATGGTSAVPAANSMLTNTENGNFLSAGNPYFSGMENSVAQSVLPQLDSQWASAGRFSGNEEAPQAIGKGLTAAMMPYAYQNYTDERQNQLKGSAMAPTLDQAQYIDPQALGGVGAEQQQMNQLGINQGLQAATWNQQQPANAWQNELANLMGLGRMGQQGSSSTYGTSSPSPLQMIMGGGMTGMGAMSSMYGPGGMFSSGGAFPGGMFGLGGGGGASMLGSLGDLFALA